MADAAWAAVALLVFATIAFVSQYRGVMAEWDLYGVLLGLIDGAVSGKGLDSPLHYDRRFGFTYIAAFYAFIDAGTLRDPDRLMALINSLGLPFLLFGLVMFWVSVRMTHGSLTATVAVVILAFAPMTLELATSGHLIQISLAFLFTAAVCLFWPASGWWAVFTMALALMLLTIGLTVRAEIFLAFPWLVLSRADTRSVPAFVRSCAVGSIAPGGALLFAFVLSALLISPLEDSASLSIKSYFVDFYTWANLVPGLLYAALGCGLATAIAGVLAAVWIALRVMTSGIRNSLRATLDQLLAPTALIAVPLIFFLPNPAPPRHFLLTLAGIGILIGWAVNRLAAPSGSNHRPTLRRIAALVAVLCLIGGNQVLAEVIRPVLVRLNEARSPYLPIPEPYHTMTHANVGWNWARHAALDRRRRTWNAFATRLLASCETNVLVISDEFPHLASRLYVGSARVDAHPVHVGKQKGILIVRDGRRFLILEETYVWPDDPIALALANPSLDAYRITLDPLLRSVYSKTPIPPDRAVRFGCD